MKKFLKESEKEEPHERACGRKDLRFRDILKKELGNKRRRSRLEDFAQIIKNMGCGSFREIKDLACDRAECCGRVIVSNRP